jgi:hypothetical protein
MPIDQSENKDKILFLGKDINTMKSSIECMKIIHPQLKTIDVFDKNIKEKGIPLHLSLDINIIQSVEYPFSTQKSNLYNLNKITNIIKEVQPVSMAIYNLDIPKLDHVPKYRCCSTLYQLIKSFDENYKIL